MQNRNKLNTLLQKWPKNTVAVYSWLKELGISKSLVEHYRRSGWVESCGVGGFVRRGDIVNEFGALFSLQNHLELPVHIGGLTALDLQGASHYVRGKVVTQIFNKTHSHIPSWFKNFRTDELELQIYNTEFLSSNKYLVEWSVGEFSVKISSRERAILEVLYLCPNKFDVMEASHLVDGLVNLRPKVMQDLLEECSSIKVKRLACFLFERAGHNWFNYIDLSNIDLGNGTRKIVSQGFYDSKYKIIMPRELNNEN